MDMQTIKDAASAAVPVITTVVTVATMAAPVFASPALVAKIGIIGKIWMMLAGNFGHAKNRSPKD